MILDSSLPQPTMYNRKTQKYLCLIVVLFRPEEGQIENVNALASRYSVVAVDNSKGEYGIRNAHYIPLHENKGIAAAQNVGIRYAREKGFKYVLLLDQDSKLDEGFVQNLVADFQEIRNIDPKVGFIGPVFVDDSSGQEYKNYSDKSEKFTRTSALIASGCLISMECLDTVGGMDESLFIDLVDFEWCWRANSMGYSGYMTRRVQMLHSIGKEYHNWHGFVLGISAPFRYYYQYRNTLWLCKRRYVPLRWKIKAIVRRMLDVIIVPIVSKNVLQVLKNMFKGIKEGLLLCNYIKY